MNNYPNFIVSTTNNLEGYEIQNYLGTVSTNVVAGTGFFSDFAASFSDVFGGLSQSYQKQLQSIYDEVIKKLTELAKKKGANSIIGLKVDFDEISGKAKQMLMVSAVGTAVFVVTEKKETHKPINTNNMINAEEVQERLKGVWIVELLRDGKITLKEEAWDLLIKRKSIDVIIPLITVLSKLYLASTNEWTSFGFNEFDKFTKGKETFLNKARSFFLALPSSESHDIVYEYLVKHPELFEFFKPIIAEAGIIDFKIINENINSDSLRLKKKWMALLDYDKEFYSQTDIKLIDELIVKLNNSFPNLSSNKEGGVFSKKEKWVCAFCKTANDSDKEYCASVDCGHDKFGFRNKEKNNFNYIELLKQKKKILEEILL